jgi:hypothetical protein
VNLIATPANHPSMIDDRSVSVTAGKNRPKDKATYVHFGLTAPWVQ